MPVTVERRSLTRRTSLEDHMQTALDAVRADVIGETVSDVMALVNAVPADLRPRAIKAARQSLSDALLSLDTTQQAKVVLTHWSAGTRKAKAQQAADSVFQSISQAVSDANSAEAERAA